MSRSHKKLEIQLCGIYAKSQRSKAYLRSLLNQGNLVVNSVKKEDGLTIAEVFVQLKPDYVQKIHPSTEMVMAEVATVVDYQACPSAEYLGIAAAIVAQ